jgi:phage-related holin
MKTTSITTILYSASTVLAFICTYFFNMAMANSEQYLALVGVVMTDGFFGVIAGTKREGFKTYKALKVLQTMVVWIIFLTVLLVIEKGFSGTAWLSETILIPFIVFQIVSALKNASMAGLIDGKLLVEILDKIDLHKGSRK